MLRDGSGEHGLSGLRTPFQKAHKKGIVGVLLHCHGSILRDGQVVQIRFWGQLPNRSCGRRHTCSCLEKSKVS